MKIGVFGGTFDPPHIGHLIPVEAAREILGLDYVRIVPAGLSPHKIGREGSSAATRLEMVRLAFGGNRSFIIDERELRREPPSFMVDTLEELHAEFPGDTLYLLLGTDNLPDFGTWKDPERILGLAEVIALARPATGISANESALSSRIKHLDTPLVEVSSSSIRALLSEGKSIRYLVPDAVRDYIIRNHLYGE